MMTLSLFITCSHAKLNKHGSAFNFRLVLLFLRCLQKIVLSTHQCIRVNITQTHEMTVFHQSSILVLEVCQILTFATTIRTVQNRDTEKRMCIFQDCFSQALRQICPGFNKPLFRVPKITNQAAFYHPDTKRFGNSNPLNKKISAFGSMQSYNKKFHLTWCIVSNSLLENPFPLQKC